MKAFCKLQREGRQDSFPLLYSYVCLLLVSFKNVLRGFDNRFRREVRMGLHLKPVVALLFVVAVISPAQTANPDPPASSGQIGYKSAVDAEQKKTLLLRDFHPVSMLHAPAHEVPKAKFYVIDVHNHINDAARIEERMLPERV